LKSVGGNKNPFQKERRQCHEIKKISDERHHSSPVFVGWSFSGLFTEPEQSQLQLLITIPEDLIQQSEVSMRAQKGL